MIILDLPYPPSVNSYWRSPNTGKLAGRTLISKKGRDYRKEVAHAVIAANQPKANPGRLDVGITAFPPDKRRRDLDNLPKAILDALTHANVIEDDSLIDRLLIERATTCPGGKVRIFVSVCQKQAREMTETEYAAPA